MNLEVKLILELKTKQRVAMVEGYKGLYKVEVGSLHPCTILKRQRAASSFKSKRVCVSE